MPQTPLGRYRALLSAGKFQPDAAQARAAAALDSLYRALKSYRPRMRGVFDFIFGASAAEAPKGLYIHGDVGRGKSALMDLFFAAAPVSRKRRIHFNAFMAETHSRIHEWRSLAQGERAGRDEFVREAGDDPIAPVAKSIFLQSTLLCLDEFQVTDVADAMILGRLFEKLFAYGAVIVLTSNVAPDRLYEGGLNRPLFLPFIALIKDRLNIVELNGPRDYRLDRMAGLNTYIAPLGPEADAAMDAAWRRLTDMKQGTPLAFEILQRKLIVPQAANGVARFSFQELCGESLGTADYLELARHFHTILIDRIPQLGPEQANAARRFTLLIDTLYDEKVKLVCSAAAPPQALFAEGENAPAFRRTASRLVEMQSADYLRQGPGEHKIAAVG
ncbi:MAG TPA: cell division protein ZapE [Micropepsaceae bacterium]|jgi:cell division protein ZapE|nr:cell division protein ZapE [Micropepsaceae bacterium]